ncbi:MAG: hypothetical protein ACD_39C00361G0001 [uncultured bacterium]|nr:MAG: hypothetical protein ACD_39C00361G0001 [uncultured bacterium]
MQVTVITHQLLDALYLFELRLKGTIAQNQIAKFRAKIRRNYFPQSCFAKPFNLAAGFLSLPGLIRRESGLNCHPVFFAEPFNVTGQFKDNLIVKQNHLAVPGRVGALGERQTVV